MCYGDGGMGILYGPESRHKDARRGRAHSGTWRIPESPPAAGFHRSARRAHAQALVRSGVAVARAPTHEATSELAARGRNRRSVRPRAQAQAQAHGRGPGPAGTPRAGTKQQRLALSLNRGDTGGIYQNACLFYGVRRLSCPLWVAAVECAEVSPCTTIGHHRFVFIRPWPSQACFQAVISRKLGPNDSALSVLSPRE